MPTASTSLGGETVWLYSCLISRLDRAQLYQVSSCDDDPKSLSGGEKNVPEGVEESGGSQGRGGLEAEL